MTRLINKLLCTAVFILPAAAWADHMNGSYHGVGPFADYQLLLWQGGPAIRGQFFHCGDPVMLIEGQADGDSGFGQASSQGGQGRFQLRWTPQGVFVEVDFGNGPQGGLFGPTPEPGACAADDEYDDGDYDDDDYDDGYGDDGYDDGDYDDYPEDEDDDGAGEDATRGRDAGQGQRDAGRGGLEGFLNDRPREDGEDAGPLPNF